MAPRPPGMMPRPIPPYSKNPTYQQQPVAPIHLSGAVQLQTGASDAPPIAAFKNPMDEPMEILEIKFEVSGAIENQFGDVPFGCSIACELMLGNYKLTNGSIPVWLFGRAENLSAESKLDTAQLVSYTAYTWRLPRPLYIPPGACITPKFNHLGYIPTTLNVRVGYSGRSCFTRPRSVYLPWVAKYASKSFNPISAASSDKSQALDLLNDTDKPFHLQRFTGRTQCVTAGGQVTESQIPSFASRYLTLRMVDSYGRPVVRTYTPFRSVFGALTRSWELEEVGAILDPGAYYRVFLKKAAMTMVGGEEGGQAQAFVGMVGWREESVREF